MTHDLKSRKNYLSFRLVDFSVNEFCRCFVSARVLVKVPTDLSRLDFSWPVVFMSIVLKADSELSFRLGGRLSGFNRTETSDLQGELAVISVLGWEVSSIWVFWYFTGFDFSFANVLRLTLLTLLSFFVVQRLISSFVSRISFTKHGFIFRCFGISLALSWTFPWSLGLLETSWTFALWFFKLLIGRHWKKEY